MCASANAKPPRPQPPMQASYRKALAALQHAGVPCLVGGSHALRHYADIRRDTKDLDLFVLSEDHARGLAVLEAAGFRTALTHPHWLAKAVDGDSFIDVIFSSGNAIGRVDAMWFEHAVQGQIMGLPVRFCPVEEMIWSKAFVMERERYDGADILHLLLVGGEAMDWMRLLRRFGPYWRVLYSYLILFGFVYPSRRSVVPRRVMQALAHRLDSEGVDGSVEADVCQGTLLSKRQYRTDIERWGFKDARLTPIGSMTPTEILNWENNR